MPKSIPEIRGYLASLANQMELDAKLHARLAKEHHDLAFNLLNQAKYLRAKIEQMHRVKSVAPRGKRISVSLTPFMAAQIRTMKRKNPKLTHREIAEHFNVNSGRVSDAIHNKV